MKKILNLFKVKIYINICSAYIPELVNKMSLVLFLGRDRVKEIIFNPNFTRGHSLTGKIIWQ